MVFDSFIFFNELDLLEIRLNVLDSIVDRFVIVESRVTFQGKPKPLYFHENRERFAPFKKKIIHIVAAQLPEHRRISPWDREAFQRNQIARGWANCGPGDIIILSDLDEIPNPLTLGRLRLDGDFKVLQQMNFCYFLNFRCVSELEARWFGPVVFGYENIAEPQKIRSFVARLNRTNDRLKDKLRSIWRSIAVRKSFRRFEIVVEGGWHFGFLGGEKKIIEKIESFAHAELNKPEFKNADSIRDSIGHGRDLFGRPLKYEFVKIDDKYPAYIRANEAHYKHLIREAP